MEKNRVFIEKNCVYGTFLEATFLVWFRSHFVGFEVVVLGFRSVGVQYKHVKTIGFIAKAAVLFRLLRSKLRHF